MTERHKRWPNTGRVPRGSRWDTPRPEVAAMEEAIHPSGGDGPDEPKGIPMTGVEGPAGPGRTPPRAEGPDGKPTEADEQDAKPAGRKGAEKQPENT